MAKWTEEDKLRALVIAEASSMSEAEKQTGIPKGTIGRWASQMKQRNEDNETKRDAKRITDIAEEAIEEAKAEVREYVADRVKQVSDGLLELVVLAKQEASDLIRTGKDPDDSKAQWLRSVVGAIAQGIEKHQLLEGKPTSRSEVKQDVSANDDRYEKTLRDIRDSLEELRKPVNDQSPIRDSDSDERVHPPVKH